MTKRLLHSILPLLLFSCGNGNTPSVTVVDRSKTEIADADTTVLPADEPSPDAPSPADAPKPKLEAPRAEGYAMPAVARGALTAAERKWVGSLIAQDVSQDHISPGGVMLFTQGSGNLAKDVSDAMENDNAQATGGCIWLELYEDRKGFMWNCTMMDDATVTDVVDPFTGEKTPSGFMFDWQLKGSRLVILLEKPLQYHQRIKGERVPVRTRHWEIALPGAPRESFSAADAFPEFGYQLPAKTKWEFFDKHLFGKPIKWKAQTFY